jgi:hypothetical protein
MVVPPLTASLLLLNCIDSYLLLSIATFLSDAENIPLSIPLRSRRQGMNWNITINTAKAMNNVAMNPKLSTSAPSEANTQDAVTSSDSTVVNMVFMTFSFL